MSEYRLEMRDVVKTFPGVKALDHAQLKLRPGTVHALMGENGAGKSTLMKCMFGIYHMDEGEVVYEGQKVQIKGPLDALNRGIAMVHQELQPIPERSIGENIYVGRYPTKRMGPIVTIDHDKMYEDAARVLNMQPAALLEVDMGYDFYGKATYILPKHEVQLLESVFEEGVRLRLLCKKARLPALTQELRELSSGTVAPLVTEEKFAHFPEG